jgi:predicted permease
MLAVLGITFPIYAVIALGYLTVRGGLFRPTDMRVLGSYVMNIALPALLFNAVATRDVNEVFNLSYMLVYLLGGLATIAVATLWFAATGIAPLRRAVAVMGTVCPNSGFVGYPMLLLALPAVAEQTLALNMLVENFLLIPLLLAMIELARSGTEADVLRKIGKVLLGVLRRPMVLGLMAGLIVSVAGIAIPAPAGRLLAVLSASASALSLFVIGGALVGVPLRGNRAVALQIVIGKLLLQPALTAAALVAVVSLGLPPLGPDLKAAIILSAAMPMFGIYTIFAQEAGHEGMASIAQLVATVLAFFTLNGLLAWIV